MEEEEEEEVCRKVCFESWGWIIGEHFPPPPSSFAHLVMMSAKSVAMILYLAILLSMIRIRESFNQGSVLFCSSSDWQGVK